MVAEDLKKAGVHFLEIVAVLEWPNIISIRVGSDQDRGHLPPRLPC